MAGRAAVALPSCPIPHSWRWGVQHPVVPVGISLGMGTPDMDTLQYKPPEHPQKWYGPLGPGFPATWLLLSHQRSHNVLFSPWPPLAGNFYSSAFCAICNCVFSQPAVCVSSITLVNSSQPFYVTHSPWKTFYQNPLWPGNSPLTLCDPFRPVNSADDFLTTVF